jgi:hypothetical protein
MQVFEDSILYDILLHFVIISSFLKIGEIQNYLIKELKPVNAYFLIHFAILKQKIMKI